MKRIVGLGAESHAVALVELIKRVGTFEVRELLNDDEEITARVVGGIPAGTSSSFLPSVLETGIHDFFMGLSLLRSRDKRIELFKYADSLGLRPLTIIHPRAVISPSASVARGCCIMAGAIISPASDLWENVTVNIGAIVESGSILRSHVQLAPGSHVGPGADIGDGSYIGPRAYVQAGVQIGDHVTIGPGAVVTCNLADGMVFPAIPVDSAKTLFRPILSFQRRW